MKPIPLDPKRNRIYKKLHAMVGEGAAAFYLEAARLLMGDSGMSTAAHVVAHLLREVESALRQVIEPLKDTRPNAGPCQPSDQSNHARSIEAALAYLDIDESSDVAKAWLSFTGKGNLSSLAHRRNLRGPRPLEDTEFQERVTLFETVLEEVLDRLERRSLDVYHLINEFKAIESPTAADTRRLSNALPFNQVGLRYFFDDLENPKWLSHLDADGFFRDPPQPRRNEEEGTIWFPPWPQSRYLARIAAKEPEQVLHVAMSIVTENVSIQTDLLDAALQMPPVHAAQLVPHILPWLASPYMLLPMKTGELAQRLAEGGQVPAAIALMRELLVIGPGTYKKEEGDRPPWPPDPRPRIDPWEYGEIVRMHLPAVVQAAPEDTLWMLVDLAAEALAHGKYAKSDAYEDLSHAWRPAIEPHEQNSLLGDVRSYLITSIADAACTLVGQEPTALRRVVTGLEGRRWTALRRIALHVLRLEGDKDPELLAERMIDPSLYNDVALIHEQSLLLRERYPSLPTETKERVLEIISSDMAGKGMRKEDHGTEEDANEAELDRVRWKMRWFQALEGYLPEKLSREFQELGRKWGRLEHPDLLSWSTGVMSGPKSPLSQNDLNAMPVGSLIEYLRQWKPPEGFTMESREGLGRALTDAVAAAPDKYSESLDLMVSLDPTYVRGIVAGFGSALEAGKAIGWGPVLRFVEQVSKLPREVEGRNFEHRWEGDPDRRGAQLEVGRLLSAVLAKDAYPLTLEHRDDVWRALAPLLEPDETAVRQNEEGTGFGDAMTSSLNDCRGQAFHALVQYSLWVKRLANLPESRMTPLEGFALVPEAKSALEAYLSEPEGQNSTVHAVLGWRLLNLAYIDNLWTEASLAAIFPTEANSRLRNAAWSAFLRANRPSTTALRLLAAQYEDAVTALGVTRVKEPWGGDPDEKLIEHIVVYFVWGKLAIDDPLFLDAWSHAPPAIRAHALHFVGTDIRGADMDAKARLQALWEWRAQLAEANPTDEALAREMAKFGYWFSSGEFDPTWSLAQLRRVLTYVSVVEGDYFVMDRLASLSTEFPLACLEVMRTMIEKRDDPWPLLVREDQISRTIAAATRSTSDDARQAARDLANRLSATGYPQYGKLLG